MTDLHPIDRVEDITPARLRAYAALLVEQGRESPAKVVGLCAELLDRVIPYCTNSGICPMCGMDTYTHHLGLTTTAKLTFSCTNCGWKP